MAQAKLILRRSHRSGGVQHDLGTVIGVVDIVLPQYDAERLSTIIAAGIVQAIPVAAKPVETTSPRAASAAGRVLADEGSSEDAKTAAGSALTQTSGRGRRRSE